MRARTIVRAQRVSGGISRPLKRDVRSRDTSMRTSPLTLMLTGFVGFVLGALCRYRALPFLKGDTILSGGRQVPTTDFAASLTQMFFIFGAVCITGSLVLFVVRRKRKPL